MMSIALNCSIDGCDRGSRVRGFCKKHYLAWLRANPDAPRLRHSEKHGLHHTPEYMVWSDMRRRCNNPSRRQYANYGGRGIKVCESWDASFMNFYKDMGPRPSSRHSIDRINNDGHYEPSNCRWATQTEQNLNRRKGRNNTSGVVGVFYNKWRHKWQTTIGINGQRITLGPFMTKEEAMTARKDAEAKYHSLTTGA